MLGKNTKFDILYRLKAKVSLSREARLTFIKKNYLGMMHSFIILHRQVHTAAQTEPHQCDVLS